jgi:hypothetical protein
VTDVPANNNGQLPEGAVSPEEAQRIRAAVTKKEQAPSSRIQSLFGNWKDVSDQLGSPFEVERIPLSKLRQMRRDPMLGFGLSFIKTPHVRAKWFINAKDQNGPNAQIAAHLDNDLRKIYPSFVIQNTNMLDFGFQAIVKRFEFRTPAGTYVQIDPQTGEQTEQPIWNQGNIQPIAWKPFVALRPEGVEPQWNNKGEFDGIAYSPADASTALGVSSTAGGAGGSNQESSYKVDVYHSLWVTNERDAAFGSVFGYPRLGYAYRYWWSYWFRWAIADRAFERKADPSVLVRYPEGYFVDPLTGLETSYQDYALEMGARMRSGGVIAMPSEPFEDANGRGTLRQWDIEFTKDAVNFEPFDKSFEYLDVQKLRSLFIPEQAFLEGKGGTSSRNVAAEMGNSFLESQAVLSAQIQENINRYLIPQWLAVNYPEFAQAGGTAEIVVQGFADEDNEFMRQLVQLLGQQEAGAKEIMKLVDLQKVLEDRGTPIVSWAEQQRRDQELANQAETQGVGQVEAVPGEQVGTVPTQTGFSYIQPREVIYLSDSDSEFVSSLPDTPHFSSKTNRVAARDLNSRLSDFYASQYEFYIGNSDDEEKYDSEGIVSAVDDVSSILSSAFSAEDPIKQTSVDLISKAVETVRAEVENFYGDTEADSDTDVEAMAREHFAGFSDWHSASDTVRIVRDLYNTEVILAAKSEGSDLLVAFEDGDRDGQMFTLEEATEFSPAPDNMIYWRPLPFNFEIDRSQDVRGGAMWDEETMTLNLSDSITPEAERKILKTVVDEIS